jgi:hypothetical protein
MNFQSDKNVEKKDQKLMYPYIQAIFPAFQMEKELTEYFFLENQFSMMFKHVLNFL